MPFYTPIYDYFIVITSVVKKTGNSQPIFERPKSIKNGEYKEVIKNVLYYKQFSDTPSKEPIRHITLFLSAGKDEIVPIYNIIIVNFSNISFTQETEIISMINEKMGKQYALNKNNIEKAFLISLTTKNNILNTYIAKTNKLRIEKLFNIPKENDESKIDIRLDNRYSINLSLVSNSTLSINSEKDRNEREKEIFKSLLIPLTVKAATIVFKENLITDYNTWTVFNFFSYSKGFRWFRLRLLYRRWIIRLKLILCIATILGLFTLITYHILKYLLYFHTNLYLHTNVNYRLVNYITHIYNKFIRKFVYVILYIIHKFLYILHASYSSQWVLQFLTITFGFIMIFFYINESIIKNSQKNTSEKLKNLFLDSTTYVNNKPPFEYKIYSENFNSREYNIREYFVNELLLNYKKNVESRVFLDKKGFKDVIMRSFFEKLMPNLLLGHDEIFFNIFKGG